MSRSTNGTGSAATDLIEMLKAQTAKELKLDMTVKVNGVKWIDREAMCAFLQREKTMVAMFVFLRSVCLMALSFCAILLAPNLKIGRPEGEALASRNGKTPKL